MLFRVLLAAVGFLLALFLSLLRKDAWPFTRYPMFSRRLDPRDVKVVRFRLVGADGELEWWNPRFYRYVDCIGDRVLSAGASGALWGAGEVLRLIALEEGGARRCSAVEVVERGWDGRGVTETILARVRR